VAPHNFADSLRELDPTAEILVLVDALDEIRYSVSGESVVDWLAECPPPPSNLHFVLTSRPDEGLLALFRRRQRDWLREVVMDAELERVRDDLTRYAAGFVTEPAAAAALAGRDLDGGQFASSAVTRANGSFQYLNALFRALDHAIARDDEKVSGIRWQSSSDTDEFSVGSTRTAEFVPHREPSECF
jgi:hypothetical protein